MRLTLLAIALAALTAAPSARATDISGSWMLNFNGPQGPIDASATFKQDGENVTGTIEGPQGSVDCSGTLKGTKLALSLTVDANGQSFEIYLMAEVDDDTLKGTFSMAEMQGDWSGKRKK
jgi:hypothetical protein